MIRGLRSPRRLGRTLIVSSVVALLGILLVPGSAMAAPACAIAGDTLTVQLVTDSTTALRINGADGNLEFIEGPGAANNPPTGVWAVCSATAAVDRININGSGLGNETLRIVADASWEGSSVVTFVNLENGNDTLDFIVDTAGDPLFLTMGTAAGGARVVSLNESGGDADLQINNAETVAVTGSGNATDVVRAQGNVAIAGGAAGAHTIPGAPLDAEFDFPIRFTGAEGNDVFEPGNADDTFLGGAGDDFVVYEGTDAAVDVDLQAGTATGGSGNDTLTDVQFVVGTLFDDNLLGSTVNNFLIGLDGNDFIDGRAGNDVMVGGLGDDTIEQGAAADGADVIDGGGNTALVANAPDVGDTVDYSKRTTDLYLNPGGGAVSGAGGCPLDAGCEDDTLVNLETFLSGTGNDRFVGSGNDEHFRGGAGNDDMVGGPGEDFFDFTDSAAAVTVDVAAGTATGNGNDTFDATVEGFNGSAQGDTFIDDILTNSIYYGQDGDDLFNQGASPSADSDAFHGGGGVDTLDYGARTSDLDICLNGENPGPGSCVPLLTNGESGETDSVLDDIENAIAGSGDDNIEGNEKNNKLTDGDGNDVSFGAQGNDDFDQSDHSNGSDNLIGGAGSDFVDYSLRTGNVRASLGGGAGNSGEGCTPGSGTATCEGDTLDAVENATTGSGNDLLIGSEDDNILNAGAGNDKVNPAEGADVLDGGDGTDRVIFTTGVGVKVNLANGTAAEIGTGAGAGGLDTLGGFENVTGSLKADIIAGDANNNKLAGLAGRDIVKGKKGDDKLKGNQGRDNLNGGGGTDSGNGGPGRDKCRKVEKRRSCER
jgi:Ca2+-binding RTX toxin-like protein